MKKLNGILIAFVHAGVSAIDAAVFTVTNTNISGAGSLHQAILDANAAPGADVIVFEIPGAGPHVILPTFAQPLPSLTDPAGVIIDGYTQAGTAPNTSSNGWNGVIQIQLDGVSASFVHGISVASSSNVIRGLSITRFASSSDGISVSANASHNVIEGNLIGVNPAGSAAIDYGNSRNGITVTSAGNNRIGGTTPAARNVISDNSQWGVYIQGGGSASNNVVQGNLIGLALNGARDGNTSGGVILLGVPRNIIGGSEPEMRNVISGNATGVEISSGSTNNLVQGNFIGTDITGTLTRSNTASGVLINNASRNTVLGNTIAFNTGRGVWVLTGTGNALRTNSIFSNGNVGITLASGGNLNQPAPVLTNALLTLNNVAIAGNLTSQPNQTYELDFFANLACDPSGSGEGELWLTSASVTTDGAGQAAFQVSLGNVRDRFITATATDPNGNTSAFSVCFLASVTAPPQTFTVINTNDNGPGSLRQAMLDVDAESNTGMDTIAFNIPGAGIQTISLLSALPTLSQPVIIDGYTQPGTSANTNAVTDNAVRLIQLDGSGTPDGTHGLRFAAASNRVHGLMISGFPGSGVLLETAGNVISGNLLDGNSGSGVRVLNVPNNLIGGTNLSAANTISGNGGFGVEISGPLASGNRVFLNFIGLETPVVGARAPSFRVSGESDVETPVSRAGGKDSPQRSGDVTAAGGGTLSGNGAGGILISDLAPNNQITGNTIGNNDGDGIKFDGSAMPANAVTFNLIGVDQAGTPHGNTGSGVNVAGNSVGVVIGAPFNVSGGQGGNLIKYNGLHGVAVAPGCPQVTVRGNAFLGNGGAGIHIPQGANGPMGGNPPGINSAIASETQTTVAGLVTAASGALVRLDVYADAICGSPAGGLVFSTVVSMGMMTEREFTINIPLQPAGSRLTCTATDNQGNTSPSSECALQLHQQGATFIVTNSDPDGEGSLQDAIAQSNNRPLATGARNTIEFNIAGEALITSAILAAVKVPVLINGSSQPGSQPNTSPDKQENNAVIGVTLKNTTIVFEEGASGSECRGLRFSENSESAITCKSVDEIRITGSVLEECGIGVRLLDSRRCSIGGPDPEDQNVFGRCALGVGIFGDASSECRVEGNLFRSTDPNLCDFYLENASDCTVTKNVCGGYTAFRSRDSTNIECSENSFPEPENGSPVQARVILNNSVNATFSQNSISGSILAFGGSGNQWGFNNFTSLKDQNPHAPPVVGGHAAPTIEWVTLNDNQLDAAGNIPGAVAGQTYTLDFHSETFLPPVVNRTHHSRVPVLIGADGSFLASFSSTTAANGKVLRIIATDEQGNSSAMSPGAIIGGGPHPDLKVTKELIGESDYGLDDIGINYHITVKNEGEVDLTGVTLVDKLPSDRALSHLLAVFNGNDTSISIDRNTPASERKLELDLGDLAVGQTKNVLLTFRFDYPAGELVNEAWAYAQQAEPDTSNNYATAETELLPYQFIQPAGGNNLEVTVLAAPNSVVQLQQTADINGQFQNVAGAKEQVPPDGNKVTITQSIAPDGKAFVRAQVGPTYDICIEFPEGRGILHLNIETGDYLMRETGAPPERGRMHVSPDLNAIDMRLYKGVSEKRVRIRTNTKIATVAWLFGNTDHVFFQTEYRTDCPPPLD